MSLMATLVSKAHAALGGSEPTREEKAQAMQTQLAQLAQANQAAQSGGYTISTPHLGAFNMNSTGRMRLVMTVEEIENGYVVVIGNQTFYAKSPQEISERVIAVMATHSLERV